VYPPSTMQQRGQFTSANFAAGRIYPLRTSICIVSLASSRCKSLEKHGHNRVGLKVYTQPDAHAVGFCEIHLTVDRDHLDRTVGRLRVARAPFERNTCMQSSDVQHTMERACSVRWGVRYPQHCLPCCRVCCCCGNLLRPRTSSVTVRYAEYRE
jgi:hypothetical protein